MKHLSLFFFFFLLLNSCKKDGKITGNNIEKDSITNSSKIDSSVEINQNLAIKPLSISSEAGTTIFTQNNKTLFYFNTRSNSGEIQINEKSYELDLLNFSDNEYHISGKNIKITATEGDFQEMKNNCLSGNFPQIIVELNDKELILNNISVQDCTIY